MVWWPSCSWDHARYNDVSFPRPTETLNEIGVLIAPVASEDQLFENVDDGGQTTLLLAYHWAYRNRLRSISFPCSSLLKWLLNGLFYVICVLTIPVMIQYAKEVHLLMGAIK